MIVHTTFQIRVSLSPNAKQKKIPFSASLFIVKILFSVLWLLKCFPFLEEFHSRSRSRQLSKSLFHLGVNMSHFGGKIAYDHQRNPSLSDLGFKRRRLAVPLSVNRSKLSIPYKSELCNLFRKGKCYYGENCHYAHNLSEIRQPGLDVVGMERNGMSRGGRECYFFSSGRGCPYGDKCYYLHQNETGLNKASGRDWIDWGSLRPHYDKFHKTRLCAKWVERSGSCPYGDKCTYAHGIQGALPFLSC